MEEWKTYTLGELSVDGKGSYGIGAPAVEYSPDKYTYLRITDINDDGTLAASDKKSVDAEGAENYILKENDIVFARTGNSTGRAYFYDSRDGELVYAGFLIKFSLDPNKVNPKILKYYTHSKPYYDWVRSFDSGATRGNINAQTFASMPIELPSRTTQDRIVDIMSAIDDKIRNNNRINHNLEEQAQALYKSWFIDFEPFKDGKFVESELGMIPEGWRVGCYNDIISSTVSGDWGKDREVGNYTHKVSCIRGCDFADVSSGIRGKTPERFVLEKNFQNKRLLDKDIIVEISGGTPTVSTGRICLVSDNLLDKYSGNIVCTNFCRVIRPCSGYSSYVFYSWLDKYNSRVMFGYENGTSGIKNFQISDFMEKEPVIIPPQTVIAQFQTIVDVYQAVIQRNGNERMECETVRDALLPKLMSGEFKINDLTC